MANYPLTKINPEGTFLQATLSSYSNEYADEACELHLRDELEYREYGQSRNLYRLRAKNPHNIEMALRYNICCPKCHLGTLKQIGRCLNYYELGLYVCPVCERR